MAIQGATQLRAELAAIRKGKLQPVYLVFGSEGYLVRTGAEAVVKAIADTSGAEVVRLDAAGKGPEAVLEPLTALSLFAPARVVVARNFAHLLTGENAERLLAGVDAGIGEGCALVLVAPGDTGEKVDKRVKGYKGLAQRGVAVVLDRQKTEDLAPWLHDRAAEQGKELSRNAASLLLNRVGPDMQRLHMELDKAMLYCLDRKKIEAADLEKLVGKSREDAVWDVATAVAEGDTVKAMELLKDLVAQGTYPLVILTLLVRQVRHLLQARLLWEELGRPPFDSPSSFRSRVANAAGSGAFGGGQDDVTAIHPFASFKRFDVARRYDVDALRAMLARLRRADRDAKTGASAGVREVLEELVLDLCARAHSAGGRAA